MRKKEYFEEYVPVNGISMYLHHYPAGPDRPVLLYLHGGPGESCAFFAYLVWRELSGCCTLVNWDQRGAGRTYLKNPHAIPDTETMLADLHGVIAHLKSRYGVDRIALLGHSWGSVLGSLYAKRHQEDLSCYIGVGQVVSMRENEEEGYRELVRRVEQSGNEAHRKQLAEIGDYPGPDMDDALSRKLPKVRALQRAYGLAIQIDAPVVWKVLRSPTFRLSDLTAFSAGEKLTAVRLDVELAAYNLRALGPRYDVPVYYVLGDRDYQTPFTIASAYLDTVEAPDKRLYLIEDAGHMTPIDQPARFAAAIKDIFARLPEAFGKRGADSNAREARGIDKAGGIH